MTPRTEVTTRWRPASGVGYVTRFDVQTSCLDRFEVPQVGGRTILEYWIPAEQLEEFNDHIVGQIVEVARFERVGGNVVEIPGGETDSAKR
ncbi:hypothetical protein [Nocardia aurantia]|uniref:Uncharacterized protein n=1 Tax=Nocardia aurantia TaxID=2585199 RepID=A0A7K0DS06_9NOCA|nr:hypothetical protein [Nocardia aurantia]MQY28543.1 hypothetical protein [Nocardia aurantia]